MARQKRGDSTRPRNALRLGALLLGIAILLGVVWRATRPGADPQVGSRPAASPDVVEAADSEPATLAPTPEPAGSPPESATRTPVAPEPTPPSPAAQLEREPSAGDVTGRVVDLHRQPVPNVTVVAKNSDQLGARSQDTTDAEGRFRLVVVDPVDELLVRDERWITLRAAEVFRVTRARKHTIVVAPAIQLAGRIEDDTGEPLDEARVELLVPRSALGAVADLLESTRQPGGWGARSDSRGNFAAYSVPAVRGAILRARCEGHATWRDAAPLVSNDALRITLKRLAALSPGPTLHGRVVHASGDPAPGARVHLGRLRTRADVEGRFALYVASASPDAHLVAVLPGFEPAVISHFGSVVILSDDAPAPVELVLPGQALEITGHLVDANGEPCAGWGLTLQTGTEVDPSLYPVVSAEDHAAGAEVRNSRAADPRYRGRSGFDTGDGGPNTQLTDETGAFRVGGLRHGQEYVLRAWNEETLVTVESAPILAGSRKVVFRVPALDLRPRVWGRIVDPTGEPIQGARVRLTMRVHRTRGGTSYQTGQEMDTGPDGAFEFTDVPRTELILRFTGGGVRSLYYELEADAPGEDLTIRLER